MLLSRLSTRTCTSIHTLRAAVVAPTAKKTHRAFSDGPSAEAIGRIQESFRAKPERAQATFHAKSVMEKGLYCEGYIRDFPVASDEPEMFGGTDRAPNPIEIVLFALASCNEITYKAYANAMGIPLKSVTIEMDGDIDFRGFFSVSEDVRPGFQAIKGTVTIESPAELEALEQLKSVVDAKCPVKDMLNVPITLELAHVPV